MRRERIWPFFFFRHLWRDEKVTSLTRILLQLLKKERATFGCCMHKQPRFFHICLKSFCSGSDIILAWALFPCRCWLWDTFCVTVSASFCMRVVGFGCLFLMAHYPHCWCGDISSLEVFLSIRFITLITAFGTCLVMHALLSPMYFLLWVENLQCFDDIHFIHLTLVSVKPHTCLFLLGGEK